FCIISSVVYIINDIKDVDKDRLHTIKKNRPLAAKTISIKNAIILAIILLIFAITLNCLCFGIDNFKSYGLLLIYLVLNIFYSFGCKNIPIVDIIILVSGFTIRVLYGATITNVIISNWLYLTVIAGSFYMALGKRRNEIKKQGDKSREVLKKYSEEFLDKFMYSCLTLCIVFYSLWCVDPITILKVGTNILIWSVPVVIVILMKYSLNIESDSSYGDPIEVILSDKILMILSICYIAVIFLTIYIYGG
ncbi:MAG: UbiA prenyltransferase family protein, partial [Clostridia bacterium]